MGENRAFRNAHGVLLAVVLVGFGASFYLRPWFPAHPLNGQPLGAPLLVHGLCLTAWFVLAFAQAALVSAGRRDAHRRVAWAAAAVVPGVVASAAWINTRVAATLASSTDPQNMFVWGNYVSLGAFLLLLAAGIRARRRPDAHRRFVLAASIVIVGPAFARFSFWPVFDAGIVGAPAFAVGGMLVALGALAAYDVASRRRILAPTVAATVTIVLTLVVGVGLGASGVGYAMLERMHVVAPARLAARP